MSKIIKMTDNYVAEIQKKFEEYLLAKAQRLGDSDKIIFSTTIGNSSEKAVIHFSELAWFKMKSLVDSFDSEIAWHGVAYRDNDESKNEYYVTDILVYPQTVTGATVDMDPVKYEEWIRKNGDDDRFYNIRMQGHSHVNMATFASTTDLDHQNETAGELPDDAFYIFLILNKKDDRFAKIYDMKKNIIFETADITFDILDGEMGIRGFLKEARELVKPEEKKPTTYKSSYTAPSKAGQTKKTSQNKKGGRNMKYKRKSEKKYTPKYPSYEDDYYGESYPYYYLHS